jgi:hypothetical protein
MPALQLKSVPGKAWNAANGCSIGKFHNTAWRAFERNPAGRGRFSAALR